MGPGTGNGVDRSALTALNRARGGGMMASRANHADMMRKDDTVTTAWARGIVPGPAQ